LSDGSVNRMADEAGTADTVTFLVRVSTWSSPREVRVSRNSIRFQLATCYPCNTCLRREQEMEPRVKRGVAWKKFIEDKILYFDFISEGHSHQTMEDFCRFLSDSMGGISITPAEAGTEARRVIYNARVPASDIPREDWTAALASLQAQSPGPCSRFSVLAQIAAIECARNARSLSPSTITAAADILAKLDKMPDDDLQRYRQNGVGGMQARAVERALTPPNRNVDMILLLVDHFGFVGSDELGIIALQSETATVVAALKQLGMWIE